METTENYITLTPSEFSEKIKSPEVYLVDVRHPDEYASGHIKGAHNIDVQTPDFVELAEKELPKGMPIAVYCGTGKRSAMASQILSSKGYKIYNLDGGLTAWKADSLPVTTE